MANFLSYPKFPFYRRSVFQRYVFYDSIPLLSTAELNERFERNQLGGQHDTVNDKLWRLLTIRNRGMTRIEKALEPVLEGVPTGRDVSAA